MMMMMTMMIICIFAISWAAPAAGSQARGRPLGSQARGRIAAIAAGLRQSHNIAGFEPRL